jgi:hypothetical protein
MRRYVWEARGNRGELHEIHSFLSFHCRPKSIKSDRFFGIENISLD